MTRLLPPLRCRGRHRPAGVAIALALIQEAAHSILHRLDLASCGLGDAAAAALGAALAAQGGAAAAAAPRSARDDGNDEGGGGLRELILSSNQRVGPAGLLALAGGIRQAGPWLERVKLCGAGAGSGASCTARLREAAEAWWRGFPFQHRQARRRDKQQPNTLILNLPGEYDSDDDD